MTKKQEIQLKAAHIRGLINSAKKAGIKVIINVPERMN